VAAVGVAAIASLEKVRCCEDEVRAFVIKVLWSERRCGIFRRLRLAGFERLWHR